MPHRMPWSFRVNQNSAGRRYKLEIRTKTILHNKYKSGRRIRQQIWWKKDAKYKRHKFTLVTPISMPPRSCQSFLAIDHPTFFVGIGKAILTALRFTPSIFRTRFHHHCDSICHSPSWESCHKAFDKLRCSSIWCLDLQDFMSSSSSVF
jgi:hypothetical protein